ncbi:MAG TPA: YfiR family protein [Thermoanaerobaculia bacterium]|nr:YfiR family protein [Thermoanaerobaculia bacterium]
MPRSWILAAGLCAAQALGDAKPPEYQVKAAFIYKFATYIRWPPRTGAEARSPFVIGIIGRDPFGPALDAVVRGQTVQGRPIVVRKLRGLEQAVRCDVLFVSSSERGNLRQIFEALRGSPVLTVGDMDQFAELGGMINLVTTEKNQIRFDINKGAVDRAGLKAASELLRLARIVESRSDGGQP